MLQSHLTIVSSKSPWRPHKITLKCETEAITAIFMTEASEKRDMLCFCSLSRFLIKTETSARQPEAKLQKTMEREGEKMGVES